MLEYLSNFNEKINETGRVSIHGQTIINPGLRSGFMLSKSQIVYGFSMPVIIEKDACLNGAFIYLSIETDFSAR